MIDIQYGCPDSQLEIRCPLTVKTAIINKWWSAGLETKGLQVQASPASLSCVLEQDILILA